MPDISMCHGVGCELREKCYRYKAKPSDGWQAYADFDEHKKPGEKCFAFTALTGWMRE